MSSATPQVETEVLPANECWNLLRTTSIGRLGVIIDDHPDIFPVNFSGAFSKSGDVMWVKRCPACRLLTRENSC